MSENAALAFKESASEYFTDSQAAKIAGDKGKSHSKRRLINHAHTIEQMAFEELEGMRESPPPADDAAKRDRASALSNLVRSWDTALERLRVLRGEALPGSRRPAPDLPKTKKSRPANRPPSAPKAQEAPTPGPANPPISPNSA